MPQLNKEEFSDILVHIVNKMIEHKQLPQMGNEQKKAMVDTVVKAFEKNLKPNEDLKLDSKELGSDAFRKTLMNALTISHSMQKDPSFKFDLGILFKKDANEKEVSTELQKLFMKLHKLEPSAAASHKELDKELEQAVKVMTAAWLKNHKEEDRLASEPAVADTLTTATDPLTAAIQQEFGGKDIRKGGDVAATITQVLGTSWVDQGGGTFANSLIGENRQLEGDDPTGSKRASEERRLTLGGLSAGLAEEFEAEGLLHESPRPKLPGT